MLLLMMLLLLRLLMTLLLVMLLLSMLFLNLLLLLLSRYCKGVNTTPTTTTAARTHASTHARPHGAVVTAPRSNVLVMPRLSKRTVVHRPPSPRSTASSAFESRRCGLHASLPQIALSAPHELAPAGPGSGPPARPTLQHPCPQPHHRRRQFVVLPCPPAHLTHHSIYDIGTVGR